jgi:DNA-binding transcriptional LysR family regulator
MKPIRLTLRQLSVFVAVAQNGSTSVASRRIALSQSATSAALNELERVISLPLFDRIGKRLQLNDNGRALLPQAQALLDSAVAIEQLGQPDAVRLHSLRIGASTSIGNYVLPQLLGGLSDFCPGGGEAGWQSRCVIANTEAICQALAGFDLDVGLVEGSCHEPGLQVQPWLCDEMVVVAAPRVRDQILAGRQTRAKVHALRELTWLLREPGSGTRQAMDALLLPHLHAYPRCLELGSSEAIMRAAAEGTGLALLSQWAVADLIQLGRLVILPTTLPERFRQCYLVWHQDKHLTPALQRFIQAAQQFAHQRAPLAERS